MARVLLLCIVGILLNSSFFYGEERPPIWRGIEPGKKFEVRYLGPADQSYEWSIKSHGAVRSYLRTIPVEPDFPRARASEKLLAQMYRLDQEYLRKSGEVFHLIVPQNMKQSLEARCFFFRPGFEKVILTPHVASNRGIYISGRVVAISAWVKGAGKKDRLKAIFADSYNRQYVVDLGDLGFTGWERLEKSLPYFAQKRDKKNRSLYGIYFRNLQVVSASGEQPGLTTFLFWGIQFLVDKSEQKYSGVDIPDNWR